MSDVHWVYAAKPGDASDEDAQRGSWPAACVHGLAQSPIDIVTEDVAAAPVLSDTIKLPSLTGMFSTKHSGHAFQLDAVPGEELINTIGTLDYKFAQVHWHTPSENTVNGEHAALEGHFVHSHASGDATYLAVIAVLYDLSSECNKELDTFWDQMPNSPGVAPVLPKPIPLGEMIEPLLAGGYYAWTGSLTTPPCSEGVDWNLLKKRLTVCQRQIDRLQAGLANAQAGVNINNRATQPLNHRVVNMTPPPSSAGMLPFSALEGFVGLALAVWSVILFFRTSSRPKAGKPAPAEEADYVAMP